MMIYKLISCIVLALSASELYANYDARSIRLGYTINHTARHAARLGYLFCLTTLAFCDNMGSLHGVWWYILLQLLFLLHTWAILISAFFICFDPRLNYLRTGLPWYYISPSNDWDSFWINLFKGNRVRAGKTMMLLEVAAFLILLPLWIWIWV